MPAEILQHSLNGFNYIAEFDRVNQKLDLKINYNEVKQTPEYLFKYYSLEKYNIEAVTSNYLFSSHPDQLNDKYDCSRDVIDYSNIPKETFHQILVTDTKQYSTKEFNDIWNSESKWILFNIIAEYERGRLFLKFGIISLSSRENDTLLWSYYTQNSGFALKFKCDLFPKEFLGPFAINYVSNLTKIMLNQNNSPLCVHYLSNIKHDIWKHECEWRYITYNPSGHYHPYFLKSDINSRKSFYNKDVIKEVILGYNFFDIKEIKRQTDGDYITLKPSLGRGINKRKLKRKLLSYIVDNKIPCSQIIRKTQEYTLFNAPIDIKRLGSNKFFINIHYPDN